MVDFRLVGVGRWRLFLFLDYLEAPRVVRLHIALRALWVALVDRLVRISNALVEALRGVNG